MSFDSTEGDVHDFFGDCQVTSVRIVEDKIDRKPKGFGYAEFATLDGLKKALDLSGAQFQGRNIRISVAEPRKSNARHASSKSGTLTCSQRKIGQTLASSMTGRAKDRSQIYQINAV